MHNSRKKYTHLNSIIQPLISQRIFPLLLGTALLATFIHFGQHGIWEPVSYPSIDFKLYYDWITKNNPPPQPGEFQPPFLALPYSPFWYFLLKPFSYFPYSIAKQLWYGCNLAIIIWFYFLSVRWLKTNRTFPDKPILYYALPGIILFNFFPIMTNLRVGQANLLVFLFIVLSFLFYQKKYKYLCGFFLSLGILTKITPLFLFLFWLIKREKQIVVSTLFSILFLWISTIPILGMEFHISYFQWIISYPFHILDNAQIITNNISIYAWLSDFTNSIGLTRFFSTAIFIFVIILFIYIWYIQLQHDSKQDEKESILEYGWTIALIPLLSHYLEDHHLVNFLLLYSIVWMYAKTPVSGWVWGMISISWFMTILAYYNQDLMFIHDSGYFMRYLNLYAALIAWIATGLMIRHIRKYRDSLND